MRKRLWYRLLFLSILFPFAGSNLDVHAQDILDQWRVHDQMERESLWAGMHWNSIGPSFMGSRIESIEVSSYDPAVMYAGFGSGGLWKTKNRGITWKHIFAHQPSFSIGDLALSEQNPNLLWLGTGEQLRASRGFSFPGTGVYKSVDGGENWAHMGLPDTHHIGQVVIDPFDSDKVFVAAMGHFWSKNEQRGLFYTDNGGQSWKHILHISDSVGVCDVVWDANNQIIYAASWQIPDGKYSRVYKSEDMGHTWKIMPIPWSGGEKIGRLALGFSSAWPENLYVLADNRNQIEGGEESYDAEIYRSQDYGQTWHRTHKNNLINNGGFGWAFGDIVPHPYNPEEIFVLGVHLLRSKDGGKSFERIRGKIKHLEPNRAKTLHLDQHDFKILPGKTDSWILGNDGGIFYSEDQGHNWIHTNTLPTGEFHDIAVSGIDQVTITGGLQDNSNIIGTLTPDDYSANNGQWKYVWLDPWSGGDGFTCLVDAADPDWVYWESQNGYLNRKNRTTGETRFIKPKPDADERPLRNSWFTPFFISPHDQRTIYYGANKMYKSTDQGSTWERSSHDLTFAKQKEKKSRSLTSIAESPVKAGILYAATEKGAVWVSRNDGRRWHEVSNDIPIKKVVAIHPSHFDLARVYLIAKGMDDDDMQAYVFVSENFGSKWKRISNNLPNFPVNCILEDPKNESILLVGNDVGVYCSCNRGKSWEALSEQLPTASIHQLRWMDDNQYLLAASHGLGLFYCHFDGIRRYSQSGYEDEAQFLHAINGVLPRQRDYSRDWDMESTHPVVLSWFSPKIADSQIDIFNNHQELIYSTTIKSRIGINYFIWDLILEYKEDESNYPLPEIVFPKEGKYDLQILLNQQVLKGQFSLRKQ